MKDCPLEIRIAAGQSQEEKQHCGREQAVAEMGGNGVEHEGVTNIFEKTGHGDSLFPSCNLLLRTVHTGTEAAERLPIGREVRLPSPAQPGIPDRSRPFGLEEEMEREVEDGQLLVAVARLPECVPEGETEIERTGRWSFLGDLPDDGEGYGGNPQRLYRPGRQSHGPVAAPSGGNQQGVVNLGVG